MNSLITGTQQRRNFLAKLAGITGISLLAGSRNAEAKDSLPITEKEPGPEDWLVKLNGKHKMVFDVTQPHEIFPFAWPKVFLLTNMATGTPEKETNSVVVLRHNGVPYALEDKLWAKYKLGEAFDIKDHVTGLPALRNPFWQPKAGEFKIPGIGPVAIGINELQASGVIFCVCDMALTVNSYRIAAKMNIDGAELKKELVAGIIPAINLVPSGLWAIGRAQEHGCGYCFAS